MCLKENRPCKLTGICPYNSEFMPEYGAYVVNCERWCSEEDSTNESKERNEGE